MRKAVFGLAASALFLTFDAALAEGLPEIRIGEWTFTPRLGSGAIATQNLVEPEAVFPSRAIRFSDGSTVSPNAGATLNEVEFDDFYESPKVLGLDLGYMASEQVEVIGGFQVTRASGDGFVNVGTGASSFAFTGPTGAVSTVALGDVIQASLDNYLSYSVEGGARYYVDVGIPDFMPYVGASLGYLNVGDVDAIVRLANANVSTGVVDYYDATSALVTGFQGGFRYEVRPGMDVGAVVNLGYRSSLDGGDSDLSLFGGGGMEDVGDDLTLGTSARVKVRF